MAWTELDNAPGTLRTGYYLDKTPLTWVQKTALAGTVYNVGSVADPNYHLGVTPQELDPNGPLNFPNKYNSGWVDYSAGGGGGGSTRPSTGMLYPRYS